MKGRGSCLEGSSEHGFLAGGLSERSSRDGYDASVVAGGLGGWMPVSRRSQALFGSGLRVSPVQQPMKGILTGLRRGAAALARAVAMIVVVLTTWLVFAVPAFAGWGSPVKAGEGQLAHRIGVAVDQSSRFAAPVYSLGGRFGSFDGSGAEGTCSSFRSWWVALDLSNGDGYAMDGGNARVQ